MPTLRHYCHMSSINELGNLEYTFFINGTIPFFSIFYHKTCQFLIYQETTQEKAGPSTLPSAVESSSVKSSKSVKSFSEYKTAKGKQWCSKVKGGKAKGTKTSAADQEVLIYIGLLEWNEKENVLKPKRGKKVALRISNSAKSSLVRQKAEEKWKAYYRNLYEENQIYLLRYEDGQQVLFIPGTSELFTLKRYHEEIGKDYNKIQLYLCTSEDYNNTLEGGDESEDEGTSHLTPKCAKLENDTAITKVGEQIQLDEQLARELESQLNQEFLQDHPVAICCFIFNCGAYGRPQFPALKFGWVVITTLYHLMLQSWYQKTAQSLVNTLLSFFFTT